MKRIFPKLLLILSFLLTVSSQQPTALTVNLSGVTTDYASVEPNIQKHYSLTINQSKATSYLFIVAVSTTNDPLQLPILDVSSQDKHWSCDMHSSLTGCIIPGGDAPDQLSIAVSCPEACSYNLYVYFGQPKRLKVGEAGVFRAQERPQILLAEYEVPRNLEFTELSVIVNIDNPEKLSNSVSVYANIVGEGVQNMDLPSKTKFNRSGVPIWDEGKGVILKQRDHIKSGDKISLVILCPQNQTLLLRSKISTESVRSIYIGQQLMDTLAGSDFKVYHLNLSHQDLYNSSIVLKMKKYSGFPYAVISSDLEFKHATLEAFTQMTTSLFLISPRKRQLLNMTDQLYIKVLTEVESVFSLGLEINTKGYMWVTDGVAEMSNIENSQVDNVFYEYVDELPGHESQDREFEIHITIKSYPNAIDFSLRQCGGSDESDIRKCVVRDVEQYRAVRQDFEAITGSYHEHLGEHVYTFRHPLSRCERASYPDNTYSIYVCYFQVAVWRTSDFEQTFVDYEVEARKGAAVLQLEEGFPKKGAVSAGQERKYKLDLKSSERVQAVKFYLTKISGDCYMLVSINPNPSMDDLCGEYKTFHKDFASTYYVTVTAYEESYYSLTAVVLRGDEGAKPNLAPLILQEGISQKVTIEKGQAMEMHFGVKLKEKGDFSVTVSRIKGSYSFDVAPFKNGKPIDDESITASQSTLEITPKSMQYPENNEFLVSVYAVSLPTSFEIFYTQNKSVCAIRPIGLPVSVFSGTETCMIFQLNKLEDLEIVLTTSFLDVSTSQMELQYSVRETTKTIKSRFTKISKDELRVMCHQQQSSDVEKCSLRVTVKNSMQERDFTLVVQYTNSDIVLFDGVTQRVKGHISNESARHFYYPLVSRKTLTVFIKSSTQADYRLVATFGEYVDVVQKKTDYPDWSERPTENIYVSETARTGLTTMVIPSNKIASLPCEKCVLLLSVFSRGNQVSVDFKIEIAQSSTTATHGESRQSYVEKGLSMQYEVPSKLNEQTVVSLNGVHQNCVKMQAYSRLSSSTDYRYLTEYQNRNPIVFGMTERPEVYLIKVIGMQSCTYQISFVSTKERILEISEGVPIDLTLLQSQKTYLIYQHASKQSFRILSMVEYGDFTLRGKTLKSLDRFNLQPQENSFTFVNPSSPSSLQVSSASPSFCSSCYYLFEVTAKINLKTTILLHRQDSSVPIMLNKITYETLRKGEFQEYVFESDESFNVTVNVLYGDGQVTIMKENEREVIFATMIDKLKVFTIKKDKGDSNRQYILRMEVKVKEMFSYTVLVSTTARSAKITQGVPSTFQLHGEQCFYFPSSSLKPNISAMLETPNSIDSIAEYSVKFKASHLDSIEVQFSQYTVEKGENILLLHLVPQSGVYTVCVEPTEDAKQLSVLVLESGVPMHMQANKELMVATQEKDLKVFEIYCPYKGWIIIEALQCRGSVDITGSKQYQKVVDKNPELKFTHAKTGGHYVSKAKVDSGLYFLGVQNHANQTESLSILKYSMFLNKNLYPYDIFDVPQDSTIQYKLQIDGGITFSVNRIMQDDNITVLKQTYRIYISNQSEKVRQASQCHSVEVFNRTVIVNKVFNPTQVIIRIEKDQLEDLVAQQPTTLFISIVGYVDLKPFQSFQTNQIRYIYNEAVINIKQTELPAKKKFVFYVGVPLLVGVLVLFLAWKFCVRKIYMADTRLTEEEAQREGAQPVETEVVTSKVVSGTAMISSANINQMLKDQEENNKTQDHNQK